jgi:NhaP-type Na+/H+ or K+/H+ antiporter
VVQLVICLPFISISATVTTHSVRAVLGPSLALIAGLVLVVRPFVAAAATFRTELSVPERALIGWMDPRGILAASTAATFAAPLAAAGVAGPNQLLPVTFIVIVATVTVYGLATTPVVKLLGLAETAAEQAQSDLPDEPTIPPPADN